MAVDCAVGDDLKERLVGVEGPAMRTVAIALGFAVAVACGGRSSRLEADDSSDTGTGGSAEGGTRAEAGQNSTGAVGGPSAGGANATGGGPPTGGATATGGRGGAAPVGGTSAGGGAGELTCIGIDAGAPPPMCQGISRDQPCAFEGVQCEGLRCGLADTGQRTCTCSTVWTCTACDFTDTPLSGLEPPFPACPANVADDIACTTEWEVCGPVGLEFCACYRDRSGCLVWDCDDPPGCWGTCGF